MHNIFNDKNIYIYINTYKYVCISTDVIEMKI